MTFIGQKESCRTTSRLKTILLFSSLKDLKDSHATVPVSCTTESQVYVAMEANYSRKYVLITGLFRTRNLLIKALRIPYDR